jgi:hypothetical protein
VLYVFCAAAVVALVLAVWVVRLVVKAALRDKPAEARIAAAFTAVRAIERSRR